MKVALIFEYLDGGNLSEYMAKKKVLDESEALTLFK
jgi:hypothetical protein